MYHFALLGLALYPSSPHIISVYNLGRRTVVSYIVGDLVLSLTIILFMLS